MLPKNLKYGSKLESAPCKSMRVNIAPQNGTDGYGLASTINFNIPTRRNLVMVPSESYLKFTHQVTNSSGGANNYRWDSCGAHGLIQRIRIFHGSNLLQDIDNYSLLAKMLFDLQVNTPSSYGKYSIIAGTRSDTFTTGNDVATINSPNATVLADTLTLVNEIKTALNAGTTTGVSVNQINSGASINNGASIVSGASSSTVLAAPTFCLNLISLIGSLCQQQYLPLFAIDTAPLRVEITLQDQINKIYGTGATPSIGTISLNNVEMICNFIELSDRAMGLVYEQLNGDPIQMVVPDYKNFQTTAAISASIQLNIPIPAKFSSLKSLFICSRDKYAADQAMPLSCVSCSLGSYYFRIGPNVVPSKAPASTAEMFCEVLKAIGSMGDIHHSPSVDLISYSLATSPALSVAHVLAGDQNSGSFYIGIDLENYSNASKDTIFAGYNTLTDDIYATFAYTAATTTIASCRFDTYALFDTVLVFENGTCFARY